MKALEGEKQTLQLEVDRLHAEKLKLQGDGAQLRQQMEVVLQSFKCVGLARLRAEGPGGRGWPGLIPNRPPTTAVRVPFTRYPWACTPRPLFRRAGEQSSTAVQPSSKKGCQTSTDLRVGASGKAE